MAGADEIEAEMASGLYTGVVGRSTDPDVVLRDLRRFLKLPALQTRGLLQELLQKVPTIRDVIVRTTADVFLNRIGRDIEVRNTGAKDIIGAHALVAIPIGPVSVRLAVQCSTDLIRTLAEPASSDSDIRFGGWRPRRDRRSDRGGDPGRHDHRAGAAVRSRHTVVDPGAAAREGLPDDAERLIVEMGAAGADGRFRVALDVYESDSREVVEERLSA
ncbi:MAG: hypothetical protein QM736_17975 [Vicinamibacterales bacterium]